MKKYLKVFNAVVLGASVVALAACSQETADSSAEEAMADVEANADAMLADEGAGLDSADAMDGAMDEAAEAMEDMGESSGIGEGPGTVE
ncbi:hypothetical protein GCM10009127_06050 [Alteraurantiacibacter aestuarii]|uniref:Circumsporozoite protein n=1 Tax=Alteraurantiacibacter aestuarii TaxID=650004 RepID=A0A844ZN43_9SPHN|nr:hypothetical protein [Alteraurantiacibacter aestuarii]MXO89083.1 hypothetical protein [Alteraurantiacibacter aestuarii]